MIRNGQRKSVSGAVVGRVVIPVQKTAEFLWALFLPQIHLFIYVQLNYRINSIKLNAIQVNKHPFRLLFEFKY